MKMAHPTRRTAFKWLAGGALAASSLPIVSPAARADADQFVVTNNYQNFKRGTINSLHKERRILNVVWEDKGRVKMRAADLVDNYPSLKEGQIVDCNWFDYVDVLIDKKTPASEARGKALMAQGAQLTGIPGMREPIRMWSMDGMVSKIDPASATLWLINATAGFPEEKAPDSGEVIQLPQLRTEAGRKSLAALKVGDTATTVWTHQTAIKVTIIR